MISASILSGGAGLGKSLITRSVCNVLPLAFPGIKCIYIPLHLMKEKQELNLHNIINNFFPDYDKREEKVMVFIDEIHLAYSTKDPTIIEPQGFIRSILGCINSGVLVQQYLNH